MHEALAACLSVYLPDPLPPASPLRGTYIHTYIRCRACGKEIIYDGMVKNHYSYMSHGLVYQKSLQNYKKNEKTNFF